MVFSSYSWYDFDMEDITLQPLDSRQYQPNIVIAILLGIYSSRDNRFVIYKDKLGSSEQYFNKFIDAIIDTVKIKNLYPLIDKIEDKDTITLKIDGFRYDQNAQREVFYTQYFKEMFKDYLDNLRADSLKSKFINMPSWKTLDEKFINTIDTSCILSDYKLQGLQFIQLIAYHILNSGIRFNWFELKHKFTENDDILADTSWEVHMSLRLNNLFPDTKNKKEEEETQIETKKLVKYSAKEMLFMKYVEDHMGYDGLRIQPDEVLEALNPDGHIDGVICKNPNKYVSNFISRLNKKYLHNKGQRFVAYKEFLNSYYISNIF